MKGTQPAADSTRAADVLWRLHSGRVSLARQSLLASGMALLLGLAAVEGTLAAPLDNAAAHTQSGLAITLGALLLFSVLVLLVRRGGGTLGGQRSDRQERLRQMQGLLDDNRAMHQRLQSAGVQTTAMNESALRRIAADLHDGPAQDLAIVLLTLDARAAAAGLVPDELPRLRAGIERAMQGLRDIAGGLTLPGMAELPLAAVVQHAALEATGKSGVGVAVQVAEGLSDAGHADAPEAVKMAVYRVVQEALANCLRHAPGHEPRVAARLIDHEIWLDISDDGPGFDTAKTTAAGHHGLAFLRERVQVLGGRIEVRSRPDSGTAVCARIPLPAPVEP
jgi:signal transduction histidine kinase